jgi:hypothetical protein
MLHFGSIEGQKRLPESFSTGSTVFLHTTISACSLAALAQTEVVYLS